MRNGRGGLKKRFAIFLLGLDETVHRGGGVQQNQDEVRDEPFHNCESEWIFFLKKEKGYIYTNFRIIVIALQR